ASSLKAARQLLADLARRWRSWDERQRKRQSRKRERPEAPSDPVARGRWTTGSALGQQGPAAPTALPNSPYRTVYSKCRRAFVSFQPSHTPGGEGLARKIRRLNALLPASILLHYKHFTC